MLPTHYWDVNGCQDVISLGQTSFPSQNDAKNRAWHFPLVAAQKRFFTGSFFLRPRFYFFTVNPWFLLYARHVMAPHWQNRRAPFRPVYTTSIMVLWSFLYLSEFVLVIVSFFGETNETHSRGSDIPFWPSVGETRKACVPTCHANSLLAPRPCVCRGCLV